MAEPNILFNNASGSDTAASGAGPGTAITGAAAAHTNGSPSTTITLTNTPDLSGVATDGSACLWMKTVSGRQFSKITAVDNGAKTVTVGDSFTIASGSAVDYAIGGKRKTIGNADSATLFGTTGAKSGWTATLEDDQSISAAITLSVTGTSALPFTIKGSGGARPIITQTANAAHFTYTAGDFCRFEFLEFRNSNATRTSANAIDAGSVNVYVSNCLFGHATNKVRSGVNRNTGTPLVFVSDTTFTDCTVAGIASGGAINVYAEACVFKVCVDGIVVTSGGLTLALVDSIFTDNTNCGCLYSAAGQTLTMVVCGNTFDGNTSSGFSVSAANTTAKGIFKNNQLTNNGAYGANAGGANNIGGVLIDGNNYYNNTSGARNNWPTGTNDQAVDPQYTDANNLDFSIGTNTKAKGWPLATRKIGGNPSAGTISYIDIGAAQRQEAAAGGGLMRHPGMSGGIVA